MSRLTSAPVLVFAGVAAAAALASGCATHSDMRPATQATQSLSAPDEAAYRQFLAEQKLPYQQFSLVGGEERHAFWEWRAQHPNASGS